jgi:shikimate kinase
VILKLKQTPGVYLVGFMGSGKTTIGRLLADRLGWNFVDVDEEIEAREQRSIADIFDSLGETAFRAVARGRPTVMALGGGAAAQTGTFELLENHGMTIWLSCSFDTVVRRVGQDSRRPLARDEKRFEELFAERQQYYERADFRVEIESDDPAVAVNAILNLPLFR